MDSALMEFVQRHLNEDIEKLVLAYRDKALPFPLEKAMAQIKGWRHITKYPMVKEIPAFIFPHSLSVEQATDQCVAEWHASLFSAGEKVLDMTAGLGIDSLCISAKVKKLTACEINEDAARSLQQNALNGKFNNIKVINCDSTQWIADCNERFSTVFIDPARRDASGGRTYALKDCVPDVPALIPEIFNISDRLLVKVSPMLDISRLVQEIPAVSKIYVVALKGETKELLLEIRKEESKNVEVMALNLKTPDAPLAYALDKKGTRRSKEIPFFEGDEKGMPAYLYEPNSAVMKCQAWDALIERYPFLLKASPNSHLFFADTFYEAFPGRVYRVEGVVKRKDKDLKGNVVSRNHPLPAEQLKKQLKIKDGDENDFIIGLRTGKREKAIILKTKKINK